MCGRGGVRHGQEKRPAAVPSYATVSVASMPGPDERGRARIRSGRAVEVGGGVECWLGGLFSFIWRGY